MSAPVKFFREREQAEATQRYLQERTIKTFLRERNSETPQPGQDAYGYDLFVLRDDDLEEAKQLIAYEFGSDWGL
jgi:hypothetical protein